MTATSYLDGKVVLHAGDCREVMRLLPDASVDAIVTDPPYGLLFMGRAWDAADGAPFAAEFWAQVLRVLKPGGHCAAFSGTRTYHRMACAIEDAGFEIRDQLAFCFGSGFPKSHNVAVGIDKAVGAQAARGKGFNAAGGIERTNGADKFRSDHPEYVPYAPSTDAARQWAGFGTALKPAWEPICLARKPLVGTVAANVLKHGVGALNIDGCRIETADDLNGGTYADSTKTNGVSGSMAGPLKNSIGRPFSQPLGRWPANLLHDGSPEVVGMFPETTTGTFSGHRKEPKTKNTFNAFAPQDEVGHGGDSGSAARFFATFPEPEQRLFYTSKAGSSDRLGSSHPTVKPLELMAWLCRLICPPGGTVLDPFAGTGTTGEAAWREGMRAILVEREPEYQADIARRMDLANQPTKRSAVAKSKNKLDRPEDLPLFGGVI